MTENATTLTPLILLCFANLSIQPPFGRFDENSWLTTYTRMAGWLRSYSSGQWNWPTDMTDQICIKRGQFHCPKLWGKVGLWQKCLIKTDNCVLLRRNYSGGHWWILTSWNNTTDFNYCQQLCDDLLLCLWISWVENTHNFLTGGKTQNWARKFERGDHKWRRPFQPRRPQCQTGGWTGPGRCRGCRMRGGSQSLAWTLAHDGCCSRSQRRIPGCRRRCHTGCWTGPAECLVVRTVRWTRLLRKTPTCACTESQETGSELKQKSVFWTAWRMIRQRTFVWWRHENPWVGPLQTTFLDHQHKTLQQTQPLHFTCTHVRCGC